MSLEGQRLMVSQNPLPRAKIPFRFCNRLKRPLLLSDRAPGSSIKECINVTQKQLQMAPHDSSTSQTGLDFESPLR